MKKGGGMTFWPSPIFHTKKHDDGYEDLSSLFNHVVIATNLNIVMTLQ
jgi:hypothetical protein